MTGGLWGLEPRMNTDQHGWIWVDDPRSGVVVSGDALAAGCDLMIALDRLNFKPRKDTEKHGRLCPLREGEVAPEPQTWVRLVGFGV